MAAFAKTIATTPWCRKTLKTLNAQQKGKGLCWQEDGRKKEYRQRRKMKEEDAS
jgi:hypothetical protein